MKEITIAGILGLTFALCFFGALAILFVPGFFERCWKRLSRPLGIAIVLGWAIVAMAAVTQIDLTTQVKNILPSVNGGTGSAYIGFSGPTAARTYTIADANATILTSNTPVSVAQGGTSSSSLTAHCVLIGEGTSAPNLVCPSTSNYVLTSTGSTSDPSFAAAPSAPNQNQGAPSGTINGTNTTFTLSPTPTASSNVNCFLNGVQQRQGSSADYQISGATITYNAAPLTGATLNCLWY